MKRNNIFIIGTLVLLLGTMAGCTKSNPTVFSWDYLGRHYVADSSSVSSGADSRIAAYSGLSALGIDGGTRLVVGSYTFHQVNSISQPYMFFDYASTEYSQSGTLNITYNDGTKMSGNFVVTYTDASTMSGSFTDIPIR